MSRQAIGNLWKSYGLLLLGAIVLGFCGDAYSQGSKAKTKEAVSKGKFSSLLMEDLEKYVAPLTGDEAPIAPAKTVTLSLSGGKLLSDVQINEALLNPGNETLKSLTVTEGEGKKKQQQKLTAALVTRIRSGDREFDVVYDPAKKGHVLIDVTARDADVGERLKVQKQRLWTEQSDGEREKTIAKIKEDLKEIQASYSFPTTVHETRFFLFLTDLPASQVPNYVGPLDSMYGKLCEAFGVPKTKNVFLGKCIILAFTTEESFLAYETKFLNNPGAKGMHGLCHHMGDGRELVACFRGNSDEATFAALIVHETTHAFVTRFRSTVGLPSWLSEGMADWVTHSVIRRKSAVERQKKSIERIQKSGSCGGNFLEKRTSLEWWQYDVAAHFVNFMVQYEPGRFRAFFLSIKDGATPDEAVSRCYDATFPELLTQYGRSIGVPHLKP